MASSWDVPWGKVGWSIAGLLITGLVGFVLWSFFGAIVVGIFLYYAVRPVYRWLDGRIDHPDVNATLSLLLVGLPILLVLAYGAFVGLQELNRLLEVTNLEQYRASLQPYLDFLGTGDGQLAGMAQNVAPQVLSAAGLVFTWLLRLFVIFAVAFYMLRDDRKIARWARETFSGEYGMVSFLDAVDEDLTTIYTGNLITIGVTGLIAVVAYYALDLVAPGGTGVAFPLLLGLLTGVSTLIPAVGMKLVYFPYTGFLLWQNFQGDGSLWFPVAFFLVTLVVVDTVPDIFIRSYLSAGDINMGLIMFTYILGAVAFGWYGVFFGPIVLVLFLHFYRYVLPNLLDPRQRRLVTE